MWRKKKPSAAGFSGDRVIWLKIIRPLYGPPSTACWMTYMSFWLLVFFSSTFAFTTVYSPIGSTSNPAAAESIKSPQLYELKVFPS
jgi:hypothetical protein